LKPVRVFAAGVVQGGAAVDLCETLSEHDVGDVVVKAKSE